MKYLSVCSGIEAASVAWHPLGWEPVAFSEIEPFPSAVLAHRFPNVPNLGNMLDYENWNIGSIGLLVGGTPCQAFSLAGKRGSLDDKRGNLCLTFCEIADKFNPEWVLWENVPGVLNTKDNAFGCLLGKLCGAESAIIPAGGGKHTNCGVVSGPKRTVAWRVLDAQWSGVPQRRRRVFVLAVRGSRNFRCADALLPVGERLPRNLKESRAARKEAARGVGKRFEGSVFVGDYASYNCGFNSGFNSSLGIERAEIAPTCIAKGPAFVFENHAQDSRVKETGDVCSTVSAKYGTGGGNTPIVMHLQQDPITGDEVSPCLGAGGTHGQAALGVCVCIQGNTIGRKPQNGGNGIGFTEELAGTLTSCDFHAVAFDSVVRKLTPMECERLQGFPDNWARIPWRSKAEAACPDSPRYKATGNSMAVTCMRWIGSRIEKVSRREMA